MSDNVELNAGTGGAILATDDVAGVQFQKVKIDVGGDGATAMLGNSNPLPVSDAGGSITVDGTVAISGAVAVTDNAGSLTVDGTVTAQDGGGSITVDAPVATPVFVRLSDGAAAISALPVTDNAGSLTVDNGGTFAVQAAQSGNWSTRTQDGSGNAITSATRGSERALTVQIVDGAGAQVTSFSGSGTQSAISTNNSTASTLLSGATFTGTADEVTQYASVTVAVIASHASATDGLSLEQSSDNSNWDIVDLYTVPATTGKTFGVQVAARYFRVRYTNGGTNQSSFRLQTILHAVMPNASSVRPQDARTNENDMQEVIAYNALYNGATWDRCRGDTTNGLDVDVTRVPTDPFGANADAASATGSISAKLRFIAATGIPVTSLPNVTLAAGTNTNEVVGDAAHDAGIAGNPVRIAGRARTSDYTAVANDDTADLLTTLNGKIVTQPFSIPELSWVYAAASGGIVNTTGVTAKAAAGAGVRNYVTRCQVINGHATVDTDVQIRDGASGTVLWRGFAKAAGGGVACDFDPPLRGTANTLVEVACGTTGTATYFNLQGYTGP